MFQTKLDNKCIKTSFDSILEYVFHADFWDWMQ